LIDFRRRKVMRAMESSLKRRDDIRPPGTVQVCCNGCGWDFWVEALDARLPQGPFLCPSCQGVDHGRKEPDAPAQGACAHQQSLQLQAMSAPAASLFEEAYVFVRQGKDREALRVLYDLIDGALIDGAFSACDGLLRALDPVRLDPACWVGVLGITRVARGRLPARAGLRATILTLARERGCSALVLANLEAS
jgi:hypothetical protein